MWRLQTSLFGILFLIIFMEVSIIPFIWSDLRVNFFIGMIIGLIIYIPFSQGFPFVILAALVLQAFSGARIGLIPLIYIIVFLSLDVIKSLLYFENVYTQIALGFFYYIAIIGISLTFTGAAGLEEKIPYLLIGAMLTGAISPAMVYIVSRLQKIYES